MVGDSKGDRKQDASSETSESEIKNPFQNFNFTSYLYEEFNQDYKLGQDNEKYHARRNRVYAFLTIPQHLESFMLYGFLQSLDHFLLLYTFMPVRCLVALLTIIGKLPQKLCRRMSEPILQPAQRCDLLRCILVIICTVGISQIDTSVIYHQIRGQSVIKLYIFFNMLEVADRLLSAVSQDALDALFWTATGSSTKSKRHQFGLLAHFAVALVFMLLHCVLLLFQASTLNVAFNSHNKSLLIIMMSNNFVELKGNVFKRFAKNNLFQMSCADVRERFHYVIMLGIVMFRNMSATGWSTEDLFDLVLDVSLVLGLEVLVDWVKHAFITKFNAIPADVYKEYTVSIAYDLLLSRQNENYSEIFDLLSRRMGLTPLPLCTLVNVIIFQTFQYPHLYIYIPPLVFGLFVVKICTNLILLHWAYSVVHIYELSALAGTSPNDEEFSMPRPCHRRTHSDSGLADLVQEFAGTVSSLGPLSASATAVNGTVLTTVASDGSRTSSTCEDGLGPMISFSGEASLNDSGRRLERSKSLDVSTEAQLTPDQLSTDSEVRLRQRTKPESSGEGVETVKQPLPDVDRFSMYSSQIV